MWRNKQDNTILYKHLKKRGISVNFTEGFEKKLNLIFDKKTPEKTSEIRRKIFSIIFRMNLQKKEKKNTKGFTSMYSGKIILISSLPSFTSIKWIGQEKYSKLIKSITGMMASQGMPTQQNIDDLMKWCTPEGADKPDMELLRAITGMMASQGMPTKEEIDNFVSLLKKKYGKNWKENISSESGKYSSQGIPLLLS